MKTYKQLVNEARPKVKWNQEYTLTLDRQGKKVYDWITEDGRFRLSLTGYYGMVGRSHPTNRNYTSWMVLDNGTPENSTHKNLAKAKKYIQDRYYSA